MCGICGVLDFNSKGKASESFLKLMSKEIIHRGPDDGGIFVEGNIGLGSRRLSIIDITGGHQPIHNEDKSLWIVFNGEIYNFPRLREILIKKGHKFYTKTDTETVLHLYEDEKEKCVKKLDGMFALAIWDSRGKQLFLARDFLGKKPLYWTVISNKFIFSSEIKGILVYPEYKRKIDRESLGKYFLYGFVPAPATIFKGIKKLLPGYYVVVKDNGQIREKKFWEIDYSKKIKGIDKEEIKDQTICLFEEAVKKRLISDVPLGVFLSGGVDSGLVTAMMTHYISPPKIQAFSIGFEEKDFDESYYARVVAKHLKVKHYLKIFSQKELLGLLPKIVDLLDEPMADSSILPTFLLSLYTKERVKVVLSGDGGDENFAGYPKYLAHFLLESYKLKKLPLSVFANLFSGKFSQFLSYANQPLYLRNQLWINPFSRAKVEELTGVKPDYSDLEKYHHLFNGKKAEDEAFFLDQKLTLADLYLVKTDRASMSASLEVRSPFLDKNLTKFAAKIPFETKLKGFETKSLLKSIAEDFLPKEVIYRPKKGFGVPLSIWLKGKERLKIIDCLSSEKIEREGVLNCEVVEDIIKFGNAQQIWALLVFEWWQERWLKS